MFNGVKWHFNPLFMFFLLFAFFSRFLFLQVYEFIKLTLKIIFVFKADRLQMIVVAKKYICVATVHQ